MLTLVANNQAPLYGPTEDRAADVSEAMASAVAVTECEWQVLLDELPRVTLMKLLSTRVIWSRQMRGWRRTGWRPL